jgi:hypothetical protein
MTVLVSQVWLPIAAPAVVSDAPTLAAKRLPGGDCMECKRVAAEPLSVWCGPCEEEIFGHGPRPLCLRCEKFPQNFNSPWCVGCGHDVDLYDAHDLRTLEEK